MPCWRKQPPTNRRKRESVLIGREKKRRGAQVFTEDSKKPLFLSHNVHRKGKKLLTQFLDVLELLL